jgi:hypothetical protein
MTLKMETGAILKAIPNNSGAYHILKADALTNLNIVGGTLKGERDEHLTLGNIAETTPYSASCTSANNCWGQWGYGMGIYGGSNIYVENVIARDCWGDGFYIRGNATNVNFYSCTLDNNRRQGISIIHANGVVIRDCLIKNTHGHNPQTGIDLEPNAGESVSNVQILNNTFADNKNGAVAAYGIKGPITNVTVTGNVTTGGTNMAMRFSYQTSNVTCKNNTITHGNWAFFTYGGLTGSTIINNTVRAPVLFYGPFTGNIITPNDFTVV